MQLAIESGRASMPKLMGLFARAEFRMRRAQLARAFGVRKLHDALPEDWQMPDSQLAKRAVEVASGLCPAFMLRHCYRSYCFGALLAARNGQPLDRETFFVAALLHDLGLSDRHANDPGSFEWVGARLARDFCLSEGETEARAALVHNAIALHTSAGIADLYEPDIAMLHFGTGLDLFGMRIGEIPPATLEEILSRYPRDNFKAEFSPCLQHQADTKPKNHIAGAMAMGLSGMVQEKLGS